MTLSADDITRLRGLVADSSFTARFDLDREVGAGGMGVVYAGTEKAGGQKIAIKLLDPGRHGDADRFAKEADILERLEHPAIVSYVAHGVTTDGRAYIAMAWLDGEPLSKRLERGPLGTLDAVLVGARVAGALAYLHELGVVHRDIKPSNVFLVGRDPAAATVIDLGIAKQLDAKDKLTRTGQLIGTPGYMAPEQVMGESTIDGRVDMFALACLLYESLTGRLPFPGEAVMEVLAHLLLHEPTPLDEVDDTIPARLATLVAVLLSKEAKDRTIDAKTATIELTAIADALARGDTEALASSQFARPVSSKASTITERPTVQDRPPAKKKSSRVALIAVLAPLAAVIAIGVLIFTSRVTPGPPEPVAASPPQTLRVQLPDHATVQRTPGPLLGDGTVVDAAAPDQLGWRIREVTWCKARDRVIAVLDDSRVVAISRDLAIEPIATLPVQPYQLRDAAVVCLDDGRILVAVNGEGFVIADGRPLASVKLPAVVDGVALGRTARWAASGAIVEWNGDAAPAQVRTACVHPRKLSPRGDRVLCSADKTQLLDDGAHTTELPGFVDDPTFAADGTLYYGRGGKTYRWVRGAESVVAQHPGPVATANWLATQGSTAMFATSLRDPALVHELALGLRIRIRAAIPEHDEVLVEIGSGQGLRIVALAKPAFAFPADRHRDAIKSLAFSPDDGALVSLSMADGRVITRTRDGSNRHVLAKPARALNAQPLLWQRDGRIALLGFGELPLWNTDGTVIERKVETRGFARAVPGTDEVLRATPSGIERIATKVEPVATYPLARIVRGFEIDRDKRHALVETTGTIAATIIDVANGRRLLELAEPTNRTIERSVLVAGEEPTLVVRDDDGQVFLIESERVTPLVAAHKRATSGLASSPTRRRVAIIAGREVIVYDVTEHRETARIELANEATAVAWNWTGTQLAVATTSTELRIYAVP